MRALPIAYDSPVTGGLRRALVVPAAGSPPPGGHALLVLLHGSGRDENAWLDPVHRLPELFAAPPFPAPLIVLPDGHVRHPDGSPLGRAASNPLFYADLMEVLLPLIAARHPFSADPRRRAVAGCSMGGGQALALSLLHPGHFGQVGVFCSGVGIAEDSPSTLAGLAALASLPPEDRPRYWLGCGTRDFAHPLALAVLEVLRANRLAHAWHEDDSAHDGPACAAHLAAFLSSWAPAFQ